MMRRGLQSSRRAQPGMGNGLGAFNPAVLPGAQGTLWLRADMGVTIGTGVAQWSDQSGNGNHVAQGLTGQQPALLASAVNGKPAVKFASALQTFLNRANCTLGITSAAYTVGIVIKDDLATPNGIHFAVADTSATAGLNLWQVGGNKFVRHVAISDGTDGAVQTSTYEYRTVNFATGAIPVLRVNGVGQTLTGSPPTTLGAPPGASYLCLGARGAGADFWGDVSIAELVVYPSSLSAANIALLEAYFKARYAL